jgi:hypothetical protein
MNETAVFEIFAGDPALYRRPVTVFYSMAGKARLGTNYTLSGIPGQVTIGVGEVSARVTLQVIATGSNNKALPVKMTLMKNSTYKLRPSKKATVKIYP